MRWVDRLSKVPKPTTNYQLPTTKRLRVAIVHDWFVGGGAERVVEQLHHLFPEAPIYTSYCTGEWRNKLDGAVRTGYLQYWPFSKLRKFISPLRALWFSSLDLSGYDLVISSSGAEAKGIKLKAKSQEPRAMHICYCHAPTHYYWSRYEDYLRHPGLGALNPLARLGLRILVGPMRRWDYKAAQRPDYLIANSNFTREQIKKYYGRDSVVIHPPVDIDRFSQLPTTNYQLPQNRHGYVVAGRQTSYKRADLAVAAATKLDVPLVVIGNGPEHRKLKRMAGRKVTFLTNVSDERMPEKLAQAKALIFPGLDDFGIVAVEALAAGTPVIAYKAGGALDYIIPGKNGLFFDKQDADSLADVIKKFDSSKFNNAEIAEGSLKYSAENFRKNFSKVIGEFFKK